MEETPHKNMYLLVLLFILHCFVQMDYALESFHALFTRRHIPFFNLNIKQYMSHALTLYSCCGITEVTVSSLAICFLMFFSSISL